MITKTPIDTIVGMNTLSWTTSDDERFARAKTVPSSNHFESELGRMGSGGKPKITRGNGAFFLTETGKPSTW